MPRAEPQFLFHGCEMPKMLQNHPVFSRAQAVVMCVHCCAVLGQPSGGRATLQEDQPYRRLLLQTEAVLNVPPVSRRVGNLPNTHFG